MTSPRNLLLIALLFLSYLLWTAWQEDYSHATAPTSPETASTTGAQGTTPAAPAPSTGEVPSATSTSAPAANSTTPAPPTAATNPTATPHVVVTTDVLRVEIDTHGGNVVVADLLAYPQEPKDYAHPVRLLDDSASRFFEAQSGLVSAQGAPDHTATFNAEKTEYKLADGTDSIEVPLTWTDASGLTVRKIFAFKRASYAIEQRQEIANKGSAPWSGNAYRQLQRVPLIIDTHGIKAYSNTERYSFIGAAYYNASDKFQKLKFDNFAKEPLAKSFAGGWAAMLQHYFFAAWIPDAAENDQYSTALVQGTDAPKLPDPHVVADDHGRAGRDQIGHRAPLRRTEAAEHPRPGRAGPFADGRLRHLHGDFRAAALDSRASCTSSPATGASRSSCWSC